MKNSNNKRTLILSMVLLVLIIVAVKISFFPDDTIESETVNTSNVENILNQVQSINFDTSVMEDGKFQSLKSIDKPLISLPIGKKNPFAPI